MTAALNRTHEVENVQQAAEQVEKIVATFAQPKARGRASALDQRPALGGRARALPGGADPAGNVPRRAFAQPSRAGNAGLRRLRRRRSVAGALRACRRSIRGGYLPASGDADALPVLLRPADSIALRICPRGIRLFWNAKSCASSIRDSRFSPKRPPSPPGRTRRSWKRR